MEQKQLEKLEELSKLKEKGILTEEEIAKYKEIIMSENKAQDDKIEQVLYVICWILILVFGLFFYYVSNVEYKNEVEPSKPSYENELRGSFDNMSRIHQSFYCVGLNSALMGMIGGNDASRTTAVQGVAYLRNIGQGLYGDETLNFIARGVQAFNTLCGDGKLESKECQDTIKRCLPISEKANEFFSR